MLDQTLISAASSLVPFWSSNLVNVFSLGNEYNMAINMVISATIKMLSGYLTDSLSVVLIFTVIFLFALSKFGYMSNLTLFTSKIPNQLIIVEPIESNEFTVSAKFKAINLMLINDYEIKSVKHSHRFLWQLVADCDNFSLRKDLILSVKTGDKSIVITLTSYSLNLNGLLNAAIKKYVQSYGNNIVLSGIETASGAQYSLINQQVITYIINKYGLTDLKRLNKVANAETNDNSNPPTNGTTNATIRQSIVNKSPIKGVFYSIKDCKDLELETDLFLTVMQIDTIVYYKFSSKNKDLQGYLKQCIVEYSQLPPNYKYSLIFNGKEIYEDHGYTNLTYPKKIRALINHLIETSVVNRYEICQDENMLTAQEDIYFDDIVLKIEKSESSSSHRKIVHVKFILESNKVELSKYLDELEKTYENKRKIAREAEKILYYFKYQGIDKNDQPKFTERILSSKYDHCYERFEFVHSEHNNMLIQDLKQLANTEHYERTGARRKKSYLFYGEPGCGKNSSVLAMALHDERHIIEIPLNLLTRHSEFEELMNLTSINGIRFKRSQIIFLFDEMDIGLQKILDNQKKTQTQKQGPTIVFAEKDSKSSEPKYEIDLSSLLSQFDGINNYGGVIYVGITNYIDKIPDALKRSMRLTPIYFTYMRQCDAVAMIQQYYQTELSQNQIDQVPNRLISPAQLKYYCEIYGLTELLTKLSTEPIQDSNQSDDNDNSSLEMIA